MIKGLSFQGYAKGAIRNHAELLDVIIDARKSKRAIRLYAVEQSGCLSEIVITSKAKIVEQVADSGIYGFDCWAKSGARWYHTRRCLGDLNILSKTGDAGGHNRHQLFANRLSAKDYSKSLSTDSEYLDAVRRHHEWCDKAFGDLWP